MDDLAIVRMVGAINKRLDKLETKVFQPQIGLFRTIRSDEYNELIEIKKKWDDLMSGKSGVDLDGQQTTGLVSIKHYNEMKEKAEKHDEILFKIDAASVDEIKSWKDKAKKWDTVWSETSSHIAVDKNHYNILIEKAKKWDDVKDGYTVHDMQSKAVWEWQEKAKKWDEHIGNEPEGTVTHHERVYHVDKDEYNKTIIDAKKWRELFNAGRIVSIDKEKLKILEEDANKWREAQQVGFWNNSKTHLTITKHRAEFLISCEKMMEEYKNYTSLDP